MRTFGLARQHKQDPMEKIISIQNLSKIYSTARGTTKALDNVSLDINQGEIFGLLGANGAGKTTLSSIIATLHPPTSGTLLFKGTSIYQDIDTYRQALGFCPQTQNLDQTLTVEENLIFAGKYFLMPQNLIKERVNLLINQLELNRYAKFAISALSGGTKQRVLIARALMHNPEIVILDEPTVGLDPDIRRKLWEIIKSLKTQGITVILTTHYLDEAEVLSDRVCILKKGHVHLIESVAQLKAKHKMAALEDIFIEIIKENHD